MILNSIINLRLINVHLNKFKIQFIFVVSVNLYTVFWSVTLLLDALI